MSNRKVSGNPELLLAYLKHSVPAQWVAWWSELPECEEKKQFAAIIFDNDQLRSLVDNNIKATVLDFIKASQLMRRMALVEAEETIEKIADLATPNRTRKRP